MLGDELKVLAHIRERLPNAFGDKLFVIKYAFYIYPSVSCSLTIECVSDDYTQASINFTEEKAFLPLTLKQTEQLVKAHTNRELFGYRAEYDSKLTPLTLVLSARPKSPILRSFRIHMRSGLVDGTNDFTVTLRRKHVRAIVAIYRHFHQERRERQLRLAIGDKVYSQETKHLTFTELKGGRYDTICNVQREN